MEINGMDSLIVKKMIAEYYSIFNTLRQRGLNFKEENPISKVVSAKDKIYEGLKGRSFRKVLRTIYSSQGLSKLELSKKLAISVDALNEILITIKETNAALVRSNPPIYYPKPGAIYEVTFEWFVAELLKRELSGISSFGVKLLNLRYGGDYDVVSRLGDVLLYVECKSGNINNIDKKEILHYFQRDEELSPDLSILLIDSDNMPDSFKQKYAEAFREYVDKKIHILPRIRRNNGMGVFYEGHGTEYIVTAEGNLLSNLRLAVDHYVRFVKRYGLIGPGDEEIKRHYDVYE
ncbi:MAG TPA: hypothetical protein P5079_03755 [Elusimicrobiota bacterium]|nr:hypothetical protein [Elusimicrobiota bacterium]